MPNYTSHFSMINGVNYHYYRAGNGPTPLVFLHGIADDGLCWPLLAEALADDYALYLVDLRGHGKSDAPSSGYTMTNMCDELAALTKQLKLEKPIMVGHSMGGILLLTLAGLHPELPGALILEDPVDYWNFSADFSLSETVTRIITWVESNKRKTQADLLKEVEHNIPGWDQSEFEPWVNAKLRYSPYIVQMVSPTDLPMDYPTLFKNIKCPLLLITGEPEKGAILNASDIDYLQKAIPFIKSTHILGVGHNIRREKFQDFLQAVRRFLADCSSVNY